MERKSQRKATMLQLKSHQRKHIKNLSLIQISDKKYYQNSQINICESSIFGNNFTCLSEVVNFVVQKILQIVNEKVQEVEIKQTIRKTLETCQNLIENTNQYINPYNIYQQNTNDIHLQVQAQPIPKSFDPMLGFQKAKLIRLHSQENQKSSISLLISQKKNSIRRSRLRVGDKFRASRMSNMSSQSMQSKTAYTFDKLIPLRIDSDRFLESSSKHNLQNFLRQKKGSSKEISLKLKSMFDEKQNKLKTIQEILNPKSNIFKKITKDSKLTTTNKLQTYNTKQQYAYDYQGQDILLKKQFNSKNNVNIQKSVYRIIEKPNSSFQELNHQKIKKIKDSKKTKITNLYLPLLNKREFYNLSILTSRFGDKNELKDELQKKLHSNRLMFRQINLQNQNNDNITHLQIPRKPIQNMKKHSQIVNTYTNSKHLILSQRNINKNLTTF